ncbi:MAG: hypothetical protein ACREBC_17040, partial [Pyrinomonadaceae bacterium]
MNKTVLASAIALAFAATGALANPNENKQDGIHNDQNNSVNTKQKGKANANEFSNAAAAHNWSAAAAQHSQAFVHKDSFNTKIVTVAKSELHATVSGNRVYDIGNQAHAGFAKAGGGQGGTGGTGNGGTGGAGAGTGGDGDADAAARAAAGD